MNIDFIYPDTAEYFHHDYSLADFIKEWEDYEEPKDFYFIHEDGSVHIVQCKLPKYRLRGFKQIGNYFETKEEAEKAVEKLKAWKRLKDNGFEFTGWKFTPDMKHISGNFVRIDAKIPYIVANNKDLDFLFGGEDD